jgi:hypothetical protein
MNILFFILILSVSSRPFFDLQPPPAISPEYPSIKASRKDFTRRVQIINGALAHEGQFIMTSDGFSKEDDMFSESEVENLVKLLKVYVKAHSNLYYSPDFFTAEKSMLIYEILDSVLKKIPKVKQSGIYDPAFKCGESLAVIRGNFENYFQEEAKELREYLKDDKLIEPVFNFVSYGRDANIDELDPERSEEINRRSAALREKVVKANFDCSFGIHYQDIFSPFKEEIGVAEADFNQFVFYFMKNALYSLYEKEFPSSKELYHALFGDTLKLTTLDGTPIYEAFQLDKILLEWKEYRATELGKYTKDFPEESYKKLFDIAIGKLESHKTRAKELVINMNDASEIPSFEGQTKTQSNSSQQPNNNSPQQTIDNPPQQTTNKSPQQTNNDSSQQDNNDSPPGSDFQKFILPTILVLSLLINAGFLIFLVQKRRGK